MIVSFNWIKLFSQVTLFDAHTMKPEHVLEAHTGTLSDFDIHGNMLVTCGFSQRYGRILSDLFCIWATSWENLFMPYANNKGADQPAHLHSLISTFVVRCLDSIIPLVSKPEISSLYLASVAEQASLCLTWSQTPKTGFLVTRLI